MWSIIWRIILFSIPIGFFAFFLPGLLAEFIITIGIYIIVYWITKRQTQNQGFSFNAIKGQGKKWLLEKKESWKIAGITLALAAFASLLYYPLLMLISRMGWLDDPLIIWGLTLLLSGEESSLSFWIILQLFLMVVIAAPIAEELFFRGFVLNKWAEKYSIGKGIFWSSFFFMIIHIPSLMIPQLLIGIFCSIIYVKTKRLIYPIFAHALYNFLVVAFALLSSLQETSETAIQQVEALVSPSAETMQMYTFFSVLCALLLILTLFLFKRYGKNVTQEQTPYATNVHEAEDYQYFEKQRELTEEEFLKQWEARQEAAEEKENEETFNSNNHLSD